MHEIIQSGIFSSCTKSFQCSDPDETVHFKFDRFSLSYNQLLILGELKIDAWINDFDQWSQAASNFLVFSGKQHQTTDVWVNADYINMQVILNSIPGFNITFSREVFPIIHFIVINSVVREL